MRPVYAAIALLGSTSAFTPRLVSTVPRTPVSVGPFASRGSSISSAPVATVEKAVSSPTVEDEATAAIPLPPPLMDENIFKLNKVIVDSVYVVISTLYAKNDFARFYVLETVARVPYFAYLSVMHLRETFGKREPGDSERMRTHYAEADNEYHHLLIMESLGGNSSAFDRTLAQSMAFAYYWYVVGVYSLSEQAAYHLSELIEDHAYNTYNNFLNTKGDMLKTMPVPDIARKYYEVDDSFLFDQFCTVREPLFWAGKDDAKVPEMSSRMTRPKLDSLYDVFVNVRNDEKEHWKTLCNLVQYDSMISTGSPLGSTQPASSAAVH